jgi:hypothetical protein
MELAKIESLLDSYFEGETSLDQESILRDYFSSANVAPHLMAYQGLFLGLKNTQKEVSKREVSLPQASRNSRRWWLGIAASLLVLLGVVGLKFSEKKMTNQERLALIEFYKTKETLLLVSKSFNKGSEEIAVLNQFTKTKNRIFK